ncbi:MAG: toprim domain-containing protein [Planctomycetota bacterium]|jgi:DNA gyrase subunit B
MTSLPAHSLGPLGQELFVVEGESAGSAAQRVCDQGFQTVLAMQGKPMNAWKASIAKVQSNSLFGQLIQTINAGIAPDFDLERCRFEKVILLFDPDADGIHGCSLMLWFFYRWMPQLLDAGRLFVAHPPICELTDLASGTRAYPRHPAQREKILAQWRSESSKGASELIEQKPFRGLASLGQELLHASCIDPRSRVIRRLRIEDAQASLKVFGADSHSKDN